MKKSYLFNKTVVITGASGGLGFAISKILIEKYNCKIIGIARNEQKMLNSISTLGEKKANFSYKLFDVSCMDSWQDFYNYLVDNSIKVDVLINNAGFMLPFTKFENLTFEQINNIISTNFTANTISIKTLLPLIKQSSSPAIINISSSAGLCPVAGQSMYTATKFAMTGLTQTLIQDYKKQIYIAGVYPGFIKTDIMSNVELDNKCKKIIEKMMMPVQKASKKIVKRIAKKKKYTILGFDGRLMSISYRFFPKFTSSIIKKVFKISKLKMFENI